MTSTRIVIVGLMGALLAGWAGDVFDRPVWSLAIAAVLPTLITLLVARRRWLIRVPAAAVGIALAVLAVAYLNEGGLADAGNAVTSGVGRVLSTEWPSPARADLVATIALIVATCTASGTELARWGRLRLAPIAPILLGSVGVIAMAAPRGAAVWWPTAIALLAAVLAALGPAGPLGDRLRLLRGERRLLAVAVAVGAVAAAVAVPLTMSGRA
ncbi:MAG: hypothetical protein AAFP84_00565, partial [Actinomycetota bacterium]